MRQRPISHRQGFTLVELLVVIGIIALLISILMPALTKARNQALLVKCANQSRQIYMACLMFAQDNKGHLPRAAVGPGSDGNGAGNGNPDPTAEKTNAFLHWAGAPVNPSNEWGVMDYNRGVLVPYMPGGETVRKDTFYCPGDLGEKTQGGGTPSSDKRNLSYSFNAHVNQDVNGQRRLGIRISSVKHSAAKIYIFEEQAPNDLWCLLWDLTDTVTTPHPMRSDDILTARHAGQKYINATRQTSPMTSDWRRYGLVGKGNYCFFDGHVEVLSPDQVYRRPRYYMLNVPE
jgi:prepilin-type N-terminal cleavage/methylation domain-containing protein/prepilin-type processing-associated H-X9-DG protein